MHQPYRTVPISRRCPLVLIKSPFSKKPRLHYGFNVSPYRRKMIRLRYNSYSEQARALLEMLSYDRGNGPCPYHDFYSKCGWQTGYRRITNQAPSERLGREGE